MKHIHILLFMVLTLQVGNAEKKHQKIQIVKEYKQVKEFKGEGVAFTMNNPFSLIDAKTGKYRRFKTIEEGIRVGRRQVEMYITGESMHTDSATTVKEGLVKYIGHARGYHNTAIKMLGVAGSDRLYTVNLDSLCKIIMMHENVKFYEQYEANMRE